MVRRLVRVLLLVYLLSSVVSVAAWSDPEPEPGEYLTWGQFLSWMSSSGGISVVVGVLLSVGVEYVPPYEKLDKKWKRAVFFGLCLAVPTSAALLGVWTDGWPPTFADTFWPALWAGGLAFASGTMAHGYLPKLPIYPQAGTKPGERSA